MILLLDQPEIFDSQDRGAYQELRRLFARAAQGQHVLVITDPELLLRSDFFRQAAAPMERTEWEEVIERSAFAWDRTDWSRDPLATIDRPHAAVRPTPAAEPAEHCRWQLVPAQAGEFAEQALRVLLENDSDWALLSAAAHIYGFERVVDARTRGWLRVDGRGGGGGVKQALEASAQTDRLFVFVDSDRRARGVELTGTARQIAQMCETFAIPHHLTTKREIENYLPEAVLSLALEELRTRPRHRNHRQHYLRAFTAWSQLGDEERDHDDIKARFDRNVRGRPFTAHALSCLRRTGLYGRRGLEERAGGELREVLELLEAWL